MYNCIARDIFLLSRPIYIYISHITLHYITMRGEAVYIDASSLLFSAAGVEQRVNGV